eukprot:5374199-Karenia_brevis.AAC.1
MVDGVAPASANVYPDGSVTHSKQLSFALSAAGVWWPDRASPIGVLEQEYMHHCSCANGLEGWTALAGPSTSSTRAEVLGLNLALLSPLPVHAGIDNKSVVDKAADLIGRLKQNSNYTPAKPYNLQRDGDLWRIAHKAIL